MHAGWWLHFQKSSIVPQLVGTSGGARTGIPITKPKGSGHGQKQEIFSLSANWKISALTGLKQFPRIIQMSVHERIIWHRLRGIFSRASVVVLLSIFQSPHCLHVNNSAYDCRCVKLYPLSRTPIDEHSTDIITLSAWISLFKVFA